MSKSVLIEIDIAKILKEVSERAIQERESYFYNLIFEVSAELKALYYRESWTNEELFETYESFVEWAQKEEECKYLKLKVVFL